MLAHDDEAFLFVMSHAPDGGVNWKDALLRGDIDLQAAERAGALLGEIHRRSAGDPGVAGDFADLTPLLQGRVDPYHRHRRRREPGCRRRDRGGGGAAAGDAALPGARGLVAEDLLVYPDHVLALDFEVAHYGDPAFDVAFLLTHLVSSACAARATRRSCGPRRTPSCGATKTRPGAVTPPDRHVVAELGCLLLARVDGKSRIEYLPAEEPRVHVRALAYDVLRTTGRPLTRTLDRLLAP